MAASHVALRATRLPGRRYPGRRPVAGGARDRSLSCSLPGPTQLLPTGRSVGPTPLDNRTNNPFVDKAALSGRVSAVAVNPKKKKEILIGTALGGIHLSKNNGKTWKSAGDNLATLAVGAVAYAPSNPKIIYVGTGEAVFSGTSYAGVGVYKSTNGGNTWKLINNTDLRGTSISAIVVDPKNPNNLLLANTRFGIPQSFFAADSGVYRSTDGGVTWRAHWPGTAPTW